MRDFLKRLPPRAAAPDERQSNLGPARVSGHRSAMKLYEEKEMEGRKKAFESAVLRWPGITPAKMFGTPCYNANGTFFASLVTDGIVLTKLGESDRAALARDLKAGPFQPGGKTVSRWVQVPYTSPDDLPAVLSYVRKSYEAALAAPAKPAKRTQAKSGKRPRT